MARFKVVNMSPRFLPVVLEQQLVPGTFEHALHTLIDSEFDLSALEAKFKNDETGAPAYDPAVMLRIVLLGYSRGMVSSRSIERACSENVVFMAISGDTQPAYTTIAAFVRGLSDEIPTIFTEVILIRDRQGLIGRQMFAIDGVKLPGKPRGRPEMKGLSTYGKHPIRRLTEMTNTCGTPMSTSTAGPREGTSRKSFSCHRVLS
ncbi:MAG: hypothetical protein A3G24_18425 [Betaproteobacteria bacterium RIFCSPLOWO2_12_FULL_62_13]|nr:MAG: hypothetical protein A3G24_18425 [Betaproteobacteria bacterium RIFCSPLOWO2_12_FULL_62_13]